MLDGIGEPIGLPEILLSQWMDHHANHNGEYLGSCVFYEVLFNESLDKTSAWHPQEIPCEKAASLRKAAHAAFLMNPFKDAVAERSFHESNE